MKEPRPKPPAGPTTRFVHAASMILRAARKGNPGATEQPGVGESGVIPETSLADGANTETPGTARDGYTIELPTVHLQAPEATSSDSSAGQESIEEGNSLVPATAAPGLRPSERHAVVSVYSRPRAPHPFTKPEGIESDEARRTRRATWLRLDADGQQIEYYLTRAQAVLDNLSPRPGHAPRKSSLVESGLQAFGYDPRNIIEDRGAEATVTRAQNAYGRLLRLAGDMMDNNPDNVGIGSTIPIQRYAGAAENIRAKIVDIDIYGRLVTNQPDPDRSGAPRTVSFRSVVETIAAEREAATENARPPHKDQSDR